jgi:hypothetical protein
MTPQIKEVTDIKSTPRVEPNPRVTLSDVSALAPKQAPLLPAGSIDPNPTPTPKTDTASAELDRLYAEKSALESRSLTSAIGDAAVDVAGGFVGLVGSAIGLGISAVGSGVKILSPEGSAVNEFGNAIKDYAVDYTNTTNWSVGKIQSLGSDTYTKDTKLNAQISNIESGQNLQDYNESIANGDNSFIAGLSLFGKDLLDTGSRVLTDPVALQSVVAQGIGSLGPSAKLARAGVELAGIAATEFGVTQGAKLEAAKIAGSALGTGVVEGAGTYSSTITDVMGRSHEEMMQSQHYRELIGQGIDPTEAQKRVADETGMEAFRISLPAAILSGTIAAKFNANPLESFIGKDMTEGFQEVGQEFLEEGLQGGASQISQNIAIKNNVDPNQIIAEGVGEQVAVGAIAGAGMAGAIGAGPLIKENLLRRAEKSRTDQERAAVRASLTPEEQAANLDPNKVNQSPAEALFNSVVRRGVDAYTKAKEASQAASETVSESNILSNTVEAIKTGASVVKAAAAPIVNQVIKTAQNYTEKANPVIQAETVAAAQEVSNVAADPAVNTGILGTPDESVKSDTVPEVFKDAIPEKASIADTITGIVKSITEKKIPISDMKDDAILFVAQKYNELHNAAATLAPEIQAKVKTILASPDLERIRKRAARLDLNTVISSSIETVSNVVKTMTVAMSKINPTNVNPDVVDKILKQEDRGNLTPEDVKSMEVAANVARPLNNYVKNIVKIADEKYQALKATGQDATKPETNMEKVSRNLIVGNLSGENKVPSINETANRIIIGMQSPDKSVEIDGVRVPVAQIATNLRNLGQHMINKVNALNESFDKNDASGVGPHIMHDTLVRGTNFIKAGMAGSKSVNYNTRSINSTNFAKTVGADAQVLGEVYNALAKAYPEVFPKGPLEVPTIKTVENTAPIIESVPVINDQTTAVEEVPPAGGTNENADKSQKDQPTSQPETKAVEDTTLVASNTETPKGSVSEVSPISDNNGKPLVFYHGTKNQFEKFAGSEIFLTTQRGLAKEHALRAGSKGTPRLIASNVTVTNPLVVKLEGNADLDIHWLKNTLTLKRNMAAGNHDSILITNAKGDALVIATNDSQITQITDPVKDRTPDAAKGKNLRQRFYDIFKTNKSSKPYESAENILDMISQKSGTNAYNDFARNLLDKIRDGMNARLDTVLFSKADGRTLSEALKAEPDRVLDIRDFKPLHLVDPATGIYDQKLLDLASMAVINWMTTARPYGADRLDDMLKELGLTYDDVPDKQIHDLLNSVPIRTTSENLAKKVIKLWDVKVNKESQMVDIRGITEGLVKDIFTTLSQMENPLVRIIELKTDEGKTASLEISNLKGEQETIGLNAVDSLDKVLFPEDQNQASFGEKIAYVPKSQNRKSDVFLSSMEQKAIKNIQDTPHTEALPVVNFFSALGLNAWAMMAGKKDSSQLAKKHPLRLTIEGKNTSIERDFNDAFQMVAAAAGREVFYPVGITNVGRHQMKGINPQNNKLLRALITPTHSKLNMIDNQQDKDAFWLTVAQSSGLGKVDKEMHSKILASIQEKFAEKFGDAVGIALTFLETGTMDQQGFTNAMLKATGDEVVSVAQVNAVLAVARLKEAQRKNDPSHLENFETSLSFELDGKTDGSANMMVAFGQGLMTRMEYQNFKRVGLFLGSNGETLNTLFSNGKEVDLYEVTSTLSNLRMTEMINAATGTDKKRLMALQRFAAHFGDFVINPDGTIQMSRNTTKDPMIQKVYGSGETGIAEGITQSMLIGFYTKLTSMADSMSVEDHLNYQEINQDLDLLFGVKLPDVLEVNNFILPNDKMKPFAEFVKETIGTILSDSINQVLSEKTKGVNDLLVFSTNVQGEFMKLFFEQRLAEVVAEGEAEWEAAGNTSKFSLYKLSQAAYDAVVKETLAFAPYFSDKLQNIRIGDFTGQVNKTEMSSNLNGNLRSKSTMQRPDNIGVKALPNVIQGRGDAMMINRIFSADNAPKKAIPIFDGVDMAITAFKDLANQINQAVLENWDHDVLEPIVSNFDNFLAKVEEQGLGDKLQIAFSIVKKDSKSKTSVIALDTMQLAAALTEVHRLNQARKAVFKQITLAVDHMGGSGQAYIRNPDGTELTFEEINQKIQDQMDKNIGSSEPVVVPPVVSVAPVFGGVTLPLMGNNQDFYRKKDQAKADQASKYIGRGSERSSTNMYRKAFGDRANTGLYVKEDVVFTSSEGNRKGRLKPDFVEIQKAMDAGATIITDIPKDRNTDFNVGEQELAKYLSENGYQESSPGKWTKAGSQSAPAVTTPVNETLVLTDVATVVEALIRETKPHLREVIRAIRGMLPDGARIVMGTEEQIAQWRKDNLGQNQSKKLDQKTKGFYDVDANIIFIMSDNHETITHELIHMATFQAVLDHYNGTKKSVAVKNLEVLMDEFLALDTSAMSAEALDVYSNAKRAIVLGKSEATPMGDATALNEFMAWSLANEHLIKELKQTPTSLIVRMTKVAKAWIQKILGVVPIDMYSNILFNTEMIRNDDFPGGLQSNDNVDNINENTDGVTPPAKNFTNFWIDLLRKKLDAASETGLDPIETIERKKLRNKLSGYFGQAQNALAQLDIGGFALSDYQKKTYIAIHSVLAVELRLDTNALIHLGKMYEHVTNNLTPAMFGKGQVSQDRYSTVMDLMGATKNDEGISDAIAVLMALSQTSTAFRNAMDQIPQPATKPGVKTTSLNDFLTSSTGFLMQKLVVTTDTEGKGVKDILDSLADQILRQDDQNEFKALKTLMGTFSKADKFVNGLLSKLAQGTRELNKDFQAQTQNKILKTVADTVTLATSFLDKDLSKEAAGAIKNATHMGGVLDGVVFIRELVSEIVGSDAVNTDTVQMLDKVNYVVQSSRQAYREELPVILQNEFKTHPTAEQWKDLHHVLGKGDFATLFDLKNPDASFDMLNDQALLNQKIKDQEKKILKAYPTQAKDMLDKAQQLADYMNGKGAGHQLIKNAYAIHKLAGGTKGAMVKQLDILTSLYALNGTDKLQRESVARMQASDPTGVHGVLTYVQALNKEENLKTISEAARMNGYKGFIPNHSKGEVSLIIAKDANRDVLEKRGYVRVGDDTTDSSSLISRGYYMTTTKQGGSYSQGVLQQVQDTYRGVNSTTGLTVNGTTSGVISGVAVVTITNAKNQNQTVNDPKFTLTPVYDEAGDVLFYERAMNPDLMEKYLQPESNMALMVGAWAGRQVEEKFSHEYNKALITELKKIWDNRKSNTDGLFIRMDKAKDKIYAESWEVIPPQLKEDIMSTFGEDVGFMVPKSMINLALGYRDPSIVDVWTGNHRLPDAVELAVKVVAKATMGDKGYKWLANAETVTMNTISSAKDMIVIRSLVVPFMNTQSNVFQLVNRGVGTKQIMKGYKEKFAEIDKLNDNLKKIKGLQARILLAATDKNKVAILKQQIQVLEDENKRFSVDPLVEAGAYKSISEGITELDVSITDGKFGDWFESQLNKLPTGVQTVAKYGLLSKDTAIYKGANKATQYGDFIAKSIYYDDLTAKGMNHDQAMARVNEEFVNFSLLPGRARTYLEAMGATWFLSFKIRSIKVALQMMRENPVRSLAMTQALGVNSGPLTDNLIGKIYQGTLPYSLGWDMLWDAPGMNPWITVTGM